MRAVVIRPGEPPEVTEVEVGLKALQRLVGGYVDVVRTMVTPELSVDLVVNDEGLLEGLPWNLVLPGGNPLAGTVVVLANDGPEHVSLSDGHLAAVLKHLASGRWKRLLPTPSKEGGQ